MTNDERIGMTNEKPQTTRRTIHNIPDDDFRDAKVKAAQQGVTVGQYIAKAIKRENARLDSKVITAGKIDTLKVKGRQEK